MTRTRAMRTPQVLPFIISREQHLIFPEDAAFAATSERLGPALRRVARRLEDADPDVADDLVQEALIRLWELGPSRYEARDDRYVLSSVIWRMREARRKESRYERRCSLRIPLRLL